MRTLLDPDSQRSHRCRSYSLSPVESPQQAHSLHDRRSHTNFEQIQQSVARAFGFSPNLCSPHGWLHRGRSEVEALPLLCLVRMVPEVLKRSWSLIDEERAVMRQRAEYQESHEFVDSGRNCCSKLRILIGQSLVMKMMAAMMSVTSSGSLGVISLVCLDHR